MNSINQMYKSIYNTVEDINAQIDSKRAEHKRLLEEGIASYPERIANLEATLEKIDDYLLRVKGFQELAKKNISSLNVLTIEAPPGYRVNLNRLRNWSMLIDPSSDNDPYAQRVYLVAKCDECFLEKKKREFQTKLDALRYANENSATEDLKRLEEELEQLERELSEFSLSDQISDFAASVVLENERYRFTQSPESYPPADEAMDCFAPGAVMMPLRLHNDSTERVKNMFGMFYDAGSKRVLLPFELPYSKDFVMNIFCSPSKSKQLDRAIQNMLLSFITNHKAGEKNIYVIDAARYNSSALGALRKIEGTASINQIPRNPEQLTNTLEEIAAKMSDYDEVIDMCDSVREYNNSLVEPATPLSTSLVVLFGWPNSFSADDKELVKKLMMNYERYGLSFVTVSFAMNEQDIKLAKALLPEYAANNAIEIIMNSNETTIAQPEKTRRSFVWYTYNSDLNEKFVNDIKEINIETARKGNEYTTWISLAKEDIPEYERNYKAISLPFGMDGKEDIYDLSFEDENFAAYLVGASRSGKSTLIHTLITGLIRNYHPDNVELWLADFKQLEFKSYIDHLPPHVKYVLLDESTELVYDLIDRLTEKMLERQKLFSRLGVRRIDQIDTTKLDNPLPVIFVILDEFSIMSQSLSESPGYMLKLQNLLAKGAALGFKFLFSSQTFTTGVGGLTSTARAQIQQRISMKGTREEISETLELSTSLKTEQVKNWMDALPPHYALVKFSRGADVLPQVKRFLVMYIDDYSIRDNMIDGINGYMEKTEEYNPLNINSYKDKHPVLVDGNSYDKFDSDGLMAYVNSYKEKNSSDLNGDEMLVQFGTPRLMSRYKFTAITNETRENILLVARSKEQQCSMSVILSAIKSYIKQNGSVEIWAYSKNPMFKEFKGVLSQTGAKIVTDIDSVCACVSELKAKIRDKQNANTLIVLIGMERICMDFDFVDNQASESSNKETVEERKRRLQNSGAVVDSEAEELRHAFAMSWLRKSEEITRKLKAQGKTDEEIKKLIPKYIEEEKIEFCKARNIDPDYLNRQAKPVSQADKSNASDNSRTEAKSSAYNALQDFVYVVKQGSRIGYHFMLCINDYSDLMQCGFRTPDLFRYRMAFRLSVQDSRELFNNKSASTLPEHICKFDNRLEQYSFRPYLHEGVEWDGWCLNEDGSIFNPYI